ncbi:MAG: DUF1501 domain-containing protein [Planctomycetes bacterium]|nr:DUF1501 domain-containing protein [Planctomycetota bacterium]
MNPLEDLQRQLTRRQLLANASKPLGAVALASLMGTVPSGKVFGAAQQASGGLPGLPHFAPKAKRVIYLFMCGGPSHIDTFDYHPEIREHHGKELPQSIRQNQRITGMTSGQKSFPVVAPMFDFKQYGQHGTWVSELLPHTAGIVDEISIVKSINTEAINHDPAITFIQTGAQIAGRPSIGAWLAYGLGSESSDLPAFVVMVTQGGGGQPLYDRLWGSGFLPTRTRA